MPAVPDYGEPRVSPTGPNDTRFASPDTSAFGANGRQLQQFGQAIEGAGETMGKIYEREQEKANDTAVIDAENKAREAALHLTIDKDEGYANIQGGDVMHVNGQPLAVEYRTRYQQQLRDIEGSLSNPAQKQAFAKSAAALDQDFYAKAAAHEATEYKGWQQSVVKGSAELASQEIGVHYADTDYVDKRLNTLDVSVAKLGSLQGLSGDETTALQNTARSQALTGAINAALDADDTETAQRLFDGYKDKMLAPDIGKIEPVLNREATGKAALAIGDAVFNQIPGTGADQPQFEKVWSSLVHQESGGNGNAVSSKGALGSTQMLPATAQAMAKKIGVAWHPELMLGKSPEALAYQTQLGRAYFQEGLQKYGGNFYKALCYYHGGPDERQWKTKTHSYADSILAHCGVKTPGASPNATLDDAISAGRRMLEATDPNPSYAKVKAVEEEISRRWEVHHKSVGEQDEQTVSGAMTKLLQNGGDINSLDPATRNAIPGDKWDSVIGFARSVQAYGKEKRDPAHDDALYNQAITDPHALAGMSDSDFLHTYAGMGRFDDVAKYRAQLQGKMQTGGKETSGDLNYTTINRVVDSRLLSLGVDPSDKDHAGQIGAARRVLNGAITGEQRRLGRQLTDAETESFVDRQFARPGVVHTGWLGAKTQIPLFAVDTAHIPPADLKNIDDALDRAGQPKTDANRLSLYYAARGR